MLHIKISKSGTVCKYAGYTIKTVNKDFSFRAVGKIDCTLKMCAQ